MTVIVDTDVTSYLLKEDSCAELYRPHLFGLPKIISFMTLAELRRWELQNSWGAKRIKQARKFLDDFSVIYADEKLCEIWAKSKVTLTEKADRLNRLTLGLPPSR